MEIVSKEVYYYSQANDFYKFIKNQFTEYQILLVEGYLADVWHTFIQGTDYELFNNGLRWLSGGDKPEAPPSFISAAGTIPFEISYVYEKPPVEALIDTVFPFVDQDGAYIAIIKSIGAQIQRQYVIKNNVANEHDFEKSNGEELNHLASWYNITRLSDESDSGLRGRLLDFLNSFVSSGTTDAISAAIEAYTGTVPVITELWQSISYFDYNIDDYSNPTLSPDEWRTYLFAGGIPDNTYTFQAYFYDPLFQLNTFFCILPYEVITEFGLNAIKRLISSTKAAGIQGYIGWLLEENFDADALDDWEVII